MAPAAAAGPEGGVFALFLFRFAAFWTMPVIMLILITVLNDGTIVSIAYDHVSVCLWW
jgi:hypothetical protein